jgi:ribosomal-protein-alanine N-acetyltransferase
MDVSLRPVAEADLPAIAQLERACFSDPWSPKSFAAALSHPDVYFTAAVREGTGDLVGYVVSWFVAGEGEIANLAVDASVRNRGVGGTLLDATIAEATRRGAEALFLEVRDSNVTARGLYASRGFTEVGRRRQYYRLPTEDAIVLRRDASNAEVLGAKS